MQVVLRPGISIAGGSDLPVRQRVEKVAVAVDSTPTPPDSTRARPNSTQTHFDSYSGRSPAHRLENCCGKITKGAGRTWYVWPQGLYQVCNNASCPDSSECTTENKYITLHNF